MKLIFRLIAGLGLVAAAYLAAAMIGTIWTPASAVADSGAKTRTVLVLSNGYHTDIALSLVDGKAPAGLPVAATDLPGGFENVRYLVLGWGSEAAYTSLGSITDLTVGTALTALAFDQSVMHVLPFYGIPRGEGVYQVDLSESQYRRLLSFIAQTFTKDETGRSEIIPGANQGYGDVFYRAKPRFSPFYSCNVWTGQALREAGVRMGIWTPFVQSIEWSLTPALE